MDVSTFDIKQRYTQINKNSPIFSYFGQLSQAELNSILRSLELLLTNNSSSRGLKKKLFNVLIETTQNLYHYIKNQAIHNKDLVFIFVTEENDSFKIITGNYLYKREIEAIRSRIEMVNSLSTEELKELYRGILDVGVVNSGGAGLGLIDLARKSGNKLCYEFDEIDEKFSFFTLEVSF